MRSKIMVQWMPLWTTGIWRIWSFGSERLNYVLYWMKDIQNWCNLSLDDKQVVSPTPPPPHPTPPPRPFSEVVLQNLGGRKCILEGENSTEYKKCWLNQLCEHFVPKEAHRWVGLYHYVSPNIGTKLYQSLRTCHLMTHPFHKQNEYIELGLVKQ